MSPPQKASSAMGFDDVLLGLPLMYGQHAFLCVPSVSRSRLGESLLRLTLKFGPRTDLFETSVTTEKTIQLATRCCLAQTSPRLKHGLWLGEVLPELPLPVCNKCHHHRHRLGNRIVSAITKAIEELAAQGAPCVLVEEGDAKAMLQRSASQSKRRELAPPTSQAPAPGT